MYELSCNAVSFTDKTAVSHVMHANIYARILMLSYYGIYIFTCLCDFAYNFNAIQIEI